MWEMLRLVNLALAVCSAALLMATAHAGWHLMPRGVRYVWVAFVGVLLSIAYACGEQVARHTPYGPRVLFTGITLAGLSVALVCLFARNPRQPRRRP